MLVLAMAQARNVPVDTRTDQCQARERDHLFVDVAYSRADGVGAGSMYTLGVRHRTVETWMLTPQVRRASPRALAGAAAAPTSSRTRAT